MNGLEIYGEISKISKTLNYIYIEDLQWTVAKFLYVRPLTEKESRVYNKLDNKKKLPFLTKVIIKEYLKSGFPKQFVDMFYNYKSDVKFWKRKAKTDSEKSKSDSLDGLDRLRPLMEASKSERLYLEKKMRSRELFISIANTVVEKLYKEKVF